MASGKFLGADPHHPRSLARRVWKAGSKSAPWGSPGVRGPPVPGEQLKVDKLAGPNAHWPTVPAEKRARVFSIYGNPPELDSVILPSLQGTLRSSKYKAPVARRSFHPTEGSGRRRHQATERTYFRKRGSTYHLVRSPAIAKLFSVSLFSYLLNWLKLELMAEPACGPSCVCPRAPHSNFGLIKGSASPHRATDSTAQSARPRNAQPMACRLGCLW